MSRGRGQLVLRVTLLCSVASASVTGCATDGPPPGGTTPESPAQAVARRESELTGQMYDGIIRASPDCARMAAFIRGFHAAHKEELAQLDLQRRPTDRRYLEAKKVAWNEIVGTKAARFNEAFRLCLRDPEYRAAQSLVPSLSLRSYCKDPPRPPSSKNRNASVSTPAREPVPQRVLEARRIRGNPVIQPDPADAVVMAIEDLGAVPVVKMCLDEKGNVAEATLLKSSCFAGYDAKILSQIRGWKYRPFLVDDRPTPVCTSVVFIYRPR
jgi:hypothetical protein